jgi:hypothetical protein
VVAVTAVLAQSDFVRAPLLADTDDFKEWHHFVIHGPDTHVLVNFSLAGHQSARVIVVVHDGRWTGVVERCDPSQVAVSHDLGELSIAASTMRVRPDGYQVRIDLPRRGIRGEMEFTSVSRPFVVNNQPVGEGRMSWLFVPRLRTTGWLRLDDRDMVFDDHLAYHDHNWGRFRWGGDFGWTWGTVVPKERANPWSMVFLQMTDRRRLRFTSQAVYVWHRDEPAAMLLRSAVDTRLHGTLARADCTLPAPMGLIVDGTVPGVPQRLEIRAQRLDDSVRAEFRPSSHARLAHPSEVDLDRCTVLCEAAGTARVTGTVRGEQMDFDGAAVFEFLHG